MRIMLPVDGLTPQQVFACFRANLTAAERQFILRDVSLNSARVSALSAATLADVIASGD